MDSFMQMAMGINMNDELKDFRKFESHPAVKVCFNPFLPDSHKQGSAFGSGGPKPDRAARFYPDRAPGSGREFQNLGISGWISADRAARNFRDIPIFSPIKKVLKVFEASKNYNS